MNRETVLAGILPRTSVIAEIGALASPIARREEGDVIYIDHADTAALREKYRLHTSVDVAKIVEVDAVWGENTLRQAIGKDRQVDYVLASHVIEHVPDPIGWFGEIREVLRPGGELRLVIPDRRFTFDILRNDTRFADLLFAHMTRARAPLPVQVMDHLLEVAHVDAGRIWQSSQSRETVERRGDDARAVMDVARDVLENGTYRDVHSWVVTPRSFALLMKRAVQEGLVGFECLSHVDTQPYTLEFYVFMRPCSDPDRATQSWQRMADAVQDYPPGDPAQSIAEREVARQAAAAREAAAQAERERLEDTVRHLTVERDAARQRIDDIARSTSWRLTRPIRAVSRVLRRLSA